MNCQICLNNFDHSKVKPYTLSCLLHTICISCINGLKNKKCPICDTIIEVIKPNLALLELIPESEYDKLKKVTLNRISNTIEKEQQLNKIKESKLKELLAQIKQIKETIADKTSGLIDSILQNQEKLLEETSLLKKEIKTHFANVRDLELNDGKQIVESNVYNDQELTNLNDKLLEKQANIENLIEKANGFTENIVFSMNSSIGTLDPQIGEIKTNKKLYNQLIQEGIRERENSNHNSSIVFFDKAIKFLPNGSIAFHQKGLSYLKEEMLNKALECLNKAVQLSPLNSGFKYHEALCLFKLKRFNESLDSVNQAIQKNSTFHEAFNLKGLCLIEIKKYENAIEEFTKAISLEPMNKTYENNRFLAISRQKNTNDSEKSNHSALKTLSPDSHRLSKRLRKN